MSIAGILPVWTRRPIARMVEFMAPDNRSVRTRWVREPDLRAGDEICLFVSFARSNSIPEHSVFHARSWADAGFHVIIIVISQAFDEVQTDVLNFAAGVMIRENRGYDFGAWAGALDQLPEIRNASLLALVNDSLFGPLNTFEAMIARVRRIDADVIGATESLKPVRHFQSFLLFFNPGALNSESFWSFWDGVRAGGRLVAIYKYELGLVEHLRRAGLRCTALFASGDAHNPTLHQWRELIADGFPFLKVALLRDNPMGADLSGWAQAMQNGEYDPDLALRQLPPRRNWLARYLSRFRL